MTSVAGRSRKMFVGVLVLGGATMAFPAAALAAPEVPPAKEAPAGAALTVSPAAVHAGDKVKVSGNKCRTKAGPGGPQVVIGNPPAGPFVDSDPWPTVDGHGNWSTTLTIPASWSPGTYLVRGICFNAPGSDTGFAYPNVKLTVKAKASGKTTTTSPKSTTTKPKTGTTHKPTGKPDAVRATPRFTG
jgi:hypothetical protein